jgi:hypothetical protein
VARRLTWRLDHDALRRLAREHWGIRQPIRVQRKRSLIAGKYRAACTSLYRPTGEFECHLIRVYGGQSASDALKCLAHEFEHAGQGERMGTRSFTGLFFRKSRTRLDHDPEPTTLYGRDIQGWESLAEAAESRWRLLLPALRPAKGVSLSQLGIHEPGGT